MSDYVGRHVYFRIFGHELARERLVNVVAENRDRYMVTHDLPIPPTLSARHASPFCICGKLAAHLDADEDGPDWACRLPS